MTESAYDYIYDPGAYALAGGLSYGSNGDFWGLSELWAGDSWSVNQARKQWDSSTNGSVDSGWVTFSATATAGSTSAFSMSVGNTASHTAGSVSGFSEVQVIAGLTVQGTVGFQNLSIAFYHDSTLLGTVQPNGSLSVDNGDGHLSSGSAVLDVPTAYTDVNHVIVSGQFKMTAPVGTYPDPSSLFGEVVVS